MKSHKDLLVWQKSIALVSLVYQASKSFPADEIYGLTNQIRRAAVSVPSNIAEGAGRGTSKEFGHFLSISQGSLAELETQLVIARNLDYLVDIETLLTEIEQIRRMLIGLNRKLKNGPDACAH